MSQPEQDFLNTLRTSLADNTFVKASLHAYRGTEDQLKSLHIKHILVKRERKLSFTYRYKTRDIIKNFGIDAALDTIAQLITHDFGSAMLHTTQADAAYERMPERKATFRVRPPTITDVPSLDHDRAKTRLIGPDKKSYLVDLKISDQAGIVFKSAQDKYRQINRYIEVLSPVIQEVGPENLKQIVDMGAGKGYLTFALYDYLIATLNLPVQVTGVEYRQDLVDLCNRIAGSSGFTNLRFVQGSIDGYSSPGIDMLIALHACDTATDDAIYKGLQAGAGVIVVAPCCHKQVRRSMEQNKPFPELEALLKNGIFLERQAEMVTDGLRALLLEYMGYTTKVFEFISDAHTPKNVMITAVRNPRLQVRDPKVLKRIADLKTCFGVKDQHLETLLLTA